MKKYYSSIDELVKDTIQFCDTYSGVSKPDLFKFIEEREIKKPPVNTVKDELVNILLNNGVTYRELYDRFKDHAFGIHPSYFEEKFNINKTQRKKMEELGFIEIMYTVYTKVFTGTHAYVPYYSADQYFNMTAADFENWKIDNVRGYKNRVKKMAAE